MVEIPTQPEMTPEQAHQRLQEWYQKAAQLKTLKTHEHLERVALAAYYFRSPQEGTNRLDLGGGFDLKLQHGYYYKVSEEDLDQVKAADIKRLKLPWDELFVYKPEVKLSVYRKLSAEQKAFVDGILDIKESSPQLEIVPQADRAGQEAHARAADLGKAATGSQEDSSASDERIIVEDAEEAEVGHFYHDGEAWWVLNEDIEWDEVDDPSEIEILDKLLADKAPPKPKRRGRKAAAK